MARVPDSAQLVLLYGIAGASIVTVMATSMQKKKAARLFGDALPEQQLETVEKRVDALKPRQ